MRSGDKEVGMVPEMSQREEDAFNADVRRRRAERARLEKRAAEGDVDFVWAELTRPRPVAFDPAELFALLLKAADVRATRYPERFASEVLAKVVSLTTYLTLRSHWLVARRIEQYDGSSQGRGRVELPSTFTEKLIPQLLALQASLCEVLHAQSSIMRMNELARAKRAETDRAVGHQKAKAGGKANATVHGKANAKTPVKGKAKAKVGRKTETVQAHVDGKFHGNGKDGVNRIAGVLNGRGTVANGFHGDD